MLIEILLNETKVFMTQNYINKKLKKINKKSNFCLFLREYIYVLCAGAVECNLN